MTTETKDEDAASTAESAATASAAVDEVKEEAEKKTTAEVKSYRLPLKFLYFCGRFQEHLFSQY